MTKDIMDLVTAATSLLAVLIALGSLVFQYKFFHKERKPVITPLVKEFRDFILPNIQHDWESGSKIDKKFSETTIEITNYGGTTAIVESYNFMFDNLDEISRELDKHATTEEYVSIKQNDDGNTFMLALRNSQGFINLPRVSSVLKRGAILRVDEEMDIQLPSYFMVISNYMFKQLVNTALPVLILKLRYSDTEGKEHLKIFKIKWDESNNITHNSQGVSINGAVVAEFVKEISGKTLLELK